ncbi:MAG: glycosyltransferase [Candidatus Omnitrophota bacterium]
MKRNALMNQRDLLDISVVIATFNNEGNLERLSRRLTGILSKLEKSFEIIFIDDGSNDKTFEILKNINQADKRVKVVRLERNFGQYLAVTAGFNYASGEILLIMDDDICCDADDICRLLEKIHAGYEVVYSYCRRKHGSSFKRAIASYLWNLIISVIIGKRLHDTGSTLKAFSKRAIDKIRRYGIMLCFIPEVRKYKTIEIEVSNQWSNISRYSYAKLFRNAFLIILISLSNRVCSLSVIAITAGLLQILLTGISLGLRVNDTSLGSTLFLIAFLCNGFVIVIFGILSLYFKKIIDLEAYKPNYVIKEVIE